MAAATDHRDFEFNKSGSVGRAAGFLVVAAGFMVGAVVRDFDGPLTVSNIGGKPSPSPGVAVNQAPLPEWR